VKTAKSDALLDGGKEGGQSQKETDKEGHQHKARVAIASCHRLKVEVVTKSTLATLVETSSSDLNRIFADTDKTFLLTAEFVCGSGSRIDIGILRTKNGTNFGC
jgi:hypothetical protein